MNQIPMRKGEASPSETKSTAIEYYKYLQIVSEGLPLRERERKQVSEQSGEGQQPPRELHKE